MKDAEHHHHPCGNVDLIDDDVRPLAHANFARARIGTRPSEEGLLAKLLGRLLDALNDAACVPGAILKHVGMDTLDVVKSWFRKVDLQTPSRRHIAST